MPFDSSPEYEDRPGFAGVLPSDRGALGAFEAPI